MSSTHWNIHSSWSKAGVGTSVVLELKSPSSPSPRPPSSDPQRQQRQKHSSPSIRPLSKTKPSPRIAFDIGATPCFSDSIPAKYVFLSHGHVDHVGGLFSHARAHSVTCGGAVPTYFVPAPLLPRIEQCRDAMSLLDAPEEGSRAKSLIKMKLVAVHPGDEVPLKGINFGSKTSFFIRAIEVDHAGHPTLGYVLGSRTVSGLRKEYQNLDGASIRDLVRSGVPIKEEPLEKLEVAYTGDTCARGLMKQSMNNNASERTEEGGTAIAKQKKTLVDVGQMFLAELLLCELTFLDPSEDERQRNKAGERGHLHITDLDRIFSSHSQCWEESAATKKSPVSNSESRKIVFVHLSAKYQPARRALDLIAEGLPHQLRDQCHIAITSMLSQEEKSHENSIMKLIQPNGCISLADYLSWKETET